MLLTDTQPKKVRKVPPGLPSSVSHEIKWGPHRPHVPRALQAQGSFPSPLEATQHISGGTGLHVLLPLGTHVGPRGFLSMGRPLLGSGSQPR